MHKVSIAVLLGAWALLPDNSTGDVSKMGITIDEDKVGRPPLQLRF